MFEKKSFGFKKNFFGSDTDTEIGPWFRFPIPKPGFGCTLIHADIFEPHLFKGLFSVSQPLFAKLERKFDK
jgi:hypothetical protein